MTSTKYRIKLNDGTIIENLILNNDTYICNLTLSKELFSDVNLVHVEITEITEIDDEVYEVTTNYSNMKLIQFQTYLTQSWFIIKQKTSQELALEDVAAKLDFIAMMEDIDL